MKYNKVIQVPNSNIGILRVKKTNMYDVFMGLGWHNHTRIKIKETGYIMDRGSLSAIQCKVILEAIKQEQNKSERLLCNK